MHHMDQAGFNIGASITSILPMAQLVYTGDDDGRVVSHLEPVRARLLSLTENSTNGIASNDSN